MQLTIHLHLNARKTAQPRTTLADATHRRGEKTQTADRKVQTQRLHFGGRNVGTVSSWWRSAPAERERGLVLSLTEPQLTHAPPVKENIAVRKTPTVLQDLRK